MTKAKDSSTLVWVGLGLGVLYLFNRQATASSVAPSGDSKGLIDSRSEKYHRFLGPPIYLGPPISIYKEGDTVTLPRGVQPPSAPIGYYWAQAVVGNPTAEGDVTWTLLGYDDRQPIKNPAQVY